MMEVNRKIATEPSFKAIITVSRNALVNSDSNPAHKLHLFVG